MYIKQTVCYSKTNWWKVNEWKSVQRCQEKQKKAKKKQQTNKKQKKPSRLFGPFWKTLNKLSRDKYENQKNNIMSQPGSKRAKATETAKRAASCAYAVSLEQVMAPLK